VASSRRTKADPASPVLHVIENKREKFRRLGNARGKTLIKRMRLMGNLGGKGYEAGPAVPGLRRVSPALPSPSSA
jgi:hypothetical protein